MSRRHANQLSPLKCPNSEQQQTASQPPSPMSMRKRSLRSSSRGAVRKELPFAEMIVLDANILIRAILGKRVRQLLETYAAYGVRFYAPELAYVDAEKYLPALLI